MSDTLPKTDDRSVRPAFRFGLIAGGTFSWKNITTRPPPGTLRSGAGVGRVLSNLMSLIDGAAGFFR